MSSRESSASEGEVLELHQKANTLSHADKSAINASDRVFGLDGASDDRPFRRDHSDRSGRDHRGYRDHRGPRDERHERGQRRRPNAGRSPSPYRHRRSSTPDVYYNPRGPDHKRDGDRDRTRSPSPFHHTRDSQRNGPDPRSNPKRELSPLRGGGRPDKRQRAFAPPYKVHSQGREQVPFKSLSYEDDVKPAPVPNFNGDMQPQAKMPIQSQNKLQNRLGPNKTKALSNATVDVKMSNTEDDKEYALEAAVQDQVPTEESRQEKRRKWAEKRAEMRKNVLIMNASECTTPNIASPAAPTGSSVSPSASPGLSNLDSIPNSPDVMDIGKDRAVSEGPSPAANSPSAADYDPTKDMLDDRNRASLKNKLLEMSANDYDETDPKVLSTLPANKAVPAKKQKEVDMFNFDDDDDDDDNEAEEITDDRHKGTVLNENLLDNWDDPNGYYSIKPKELVDNGRYMVIQELGRGVFANVVQAEDVHAPSKTLVAIKMVRRNDTMRSASQKEVGFLKTANDADPQDKRQIIRFLGQFDHKGHLCIVFEHMHMNLRELLKVETKGHGLSFKYVRAYSRQIFSALHHLQECQIIHFDLKPDNILVSHDRKNVKLADFGTAIDNRDLATSEPTTYLVSRFYRAPEIILGMEKGYGVDMWAIGCTIYELWTGKILFTGRSNNQMIKSFLECLGWPSQKLLNKGDRKELLKHFEQGPPLIFLSEEQDPFDPTKIVIRKIMEQKKIERDLKTRVHDGARGLIGENVPTINDLNDLTELLQLCLKYHVDKRIQPKDALAHKLFVGPKAAPPKAPAFRVLQPVVKPAVLKKRGAPGIRR